METNSNERTFGSISQRAAYAYRVSLMAFTPVVPQGQPDELARSERDLHAFMKGLYSAWYETPEQFGLPLDEDASEAGDEPDPKEWKQVVRRKQSRPQQMLAGGIDFLMGIGQTGRITGTTLLLDRADYSVLLKNNKIKKPFLKGLEQAGLMVTEQGETAQFSSPAYPAMMPALKALAEACTRCEPPNLQRFHFARCDFRTLNGLFGPDALELYPIMGPTDSELVTRLHHFLAELNYKPIYGIHDVHAWEVQYQGPRAIKASPFLRVQYSERHRNPLQVEVKCASTNRIIPLIYQQPRFLQEDFARRVNPCGGSKCNWCKKHKGLGPSEFTFDGQTRTICWYHNPDIDEFNEDALRVIEQYALMHEELA